MGRWRRRRSSTSRPLPSIATYGAAATAEEEPAADEGAADGAGATPTAGAQIGGASDAAAAEAASAADALAAEDPIVFASLASSKTLDLLQRVVETRERLESAGVDSTLIVLKGAGHGGPQFNSDESKVAVLEFFTKKLKQP